MNFYRSLIGIIALIFFIQNRIYSQSTEKRDSTSNVECLRFLCQVTSKVQFNSPVEVMLYLNNKVIDHKTLDQKNKFEYILESDSYYIVQISSPFYITRYAVINTNLPERVKTDPSYFFIHEMEMELHEQPKVYYPPGVDSDILDEPITIIRFFSEEENFGVDTKYTDRIKRELREFKKSIDELETGQPSNH